MPMSRVSPITKPIENYPMIPVTGSMDDRVMKGRILIIDDTPVNLVLLSFLLSEAGYQVRSALSGEAGLTEVRTVPPDLILLDICMPGMDGYTVCRSLKSDERYCHIPVIFLSAYNTLTDKINAFEVGGVDYITKPFHSPEVLARISLHLKLRRSQQELESSYDQIQLMLAKERETNLLRSQFVSMIAHDFRTPLTTIQGFASLFKASLGELSESQQLFFLDKIENSVDYILEVLDRFLLVNQAEQGTLTAHSEPIDLRSFCCNLIENFKVSCLQTHHLTFICKEDFYQFVLDKRLLQAILENLLSNALKYSPNGGEILLTLECTPNKIYLQVRDWGIGIPLENQAHLFDAFYRANNTGSIKGTGLGLAIVKKCVEALDGKIQVESKEGEGSTFTLSLPAQRH
jgi:signal transduction histidine kinase